MREPEKPDIEEVKAEKHVIEIMGPAEPLDGSKPEFAEAKPNDSIARAVPIKSETAQPPEEDISAINEKLRAQVEASGNGDLDMSELPTDFTSNGVDDDPSVDAAVEDILHADADPVLPHIPEETPTIMKMPLHERIKNGWLNWWATPWKRYGTMAFLVLLITLPLFVSPIRVWTLNTMGVRSSLLVNVVDGATNMPLQNAVVQVDNVSGKTDAEGQLRLKGIRLGKKEVRISKTAFATTNKKVTFGMRIVDLGDVTLKAVGVQLTYHFTDYLSNKPIPEVELVSGEATAKADKSGKATLTIAPNSGTYAKVTITKKGYRTETITPDSDTSARVEQKLVPSARAIFVTKETGQYDVYKMYLDGKDRSILLAGTGLENQSIVALPSPSGDKVAVVSTRDDKRNKDGYLLTALNVVDTESGNAVNLDYAEQIALLGWRGNTLVYLQTVAGTSAANAGRQKIVAYDLAANKRFQLANANYFAGSELVGNTLYYTVSATDPNAQETFARINIDGTAKKTLFTGNVWSLLRTDYQTLKLQTHDKWYQYTIGASAPVESTPVNNYNSRFYLDNPDAKTSVWVDVRDARGVLLQRNLATSKETELITQKNMQAPVYWLNEKTIIYRVVGASEVADYAISLDGGQPKKIADVSLTNVR